MGHSQREPHSKKVIRDGVAVYMGGKLASDGYGGSVILAGRGICDERAKMGDKLNRAHANEEPCLKRVFESVHGEAH